MANFLLIQLLLCASVFAIRTAHAACPAGTIQGMTCFPIEKCVYTYLTEQGLLLGLKPLGIFMEEILKTEKIPWRRAGLIRLRPR